MAVEYGLTPSHRVALNRYPPENDEQKEKLGAWFSKNGFNETVPKVPGYLDALKQKYPNIKSWGILGVSLPSPLAFLLFFL